MVLYFIVLTALSSYSALQTSWSEGPGDYGPCTLWSDNFHESSSINWHPFDDHIQLESRSKMIVEDEFDGARFIEVSDIDGNGAPDIVVCGSEADEIAWWENPFSTDSATDESIWEKHVIAAQFDFACSASAGDIDGDGDTDVAGAAWNLDTVAWWENSDTAPGIIWTEHIISYECYEASTVVAQDLDGDGDIDIAGASTYSDTVFWWENLDGSGTQWHEHSITETIDFVYCLRASDIDGDGDSDLAGAALDGGEVVWWENTGNSSWPERQICSTPGPRSVYSSDIDGDGDQDVLVASSEVLWCENIDDGQSWTKHCIDSYFGPMNVCAGDMDGDGDSDVVATSSMTNDMISWWENVDGLGSTWIEHVIGSADYPYGIGTIDMNSDGNLEVIATAWHGDKILLWDLAVEGYKSSGSLSSTVLDSDLNDLIWEYWYWGATTPETTSVAFQFRISDNSQDMGTWSDTVFTPVQLHEIINNEGRYLQYKVILTSADSLVTPCLNFISLYWSSTDISQHVSAPVNCTALTVTPNPVVDHAVIGFHLPAGFGTLTVYDITGRICNVMIVEEVPSGTISMDFRTLNPGIYFCRLSAGSYQDIFRFTVIE